jgi:ubiquitin carboxyl-terminal hydrolase 7
MNFANAHLERRLEEEAAEREARRKEREESHLYLNVRVITDDSFRAYTGTDLTAFDLKNESEPSAARPYRLLRKTSVQELAERVAEDTNSDPKRIRIWCMVNRQNKTVRPDVPIMEPQMSIEEVHQKMSGTKTTDLRVWAELVEDINYEGDVKLPTHTVLPNGATSKTDIIVLFLKWFDVNQQTLTGAGHIYISREKKVEDLVPAILKKMRWPERSSSGERQQLRLFEVCNIPLL